ncbi:MAG: DUF3322 domain-containing protein, partial [Cellulomonas sp.]|nr:DUF3322 domain-containing protein [Cellulomonas sp.]
MTWTTSADIRTKVRRRWDDQTLLRALACDDPFPAVSVTLHGPPVAQIGDDLLAVQDWVARLERGARADTCYGLEYADVGGRAFGRNRLPARAHVTSYDQAWALLKVADQVGRYLDILTEASGEPAVRAWVAQHPFRALRLDASWTAMLAAFRWLSQARGSGVYVRQITAPGVDTKFVERYRGTLAQMLGV